MKWAPFTPNSKTNQGPHICSSHWLFQLFNRVDTTPVNTCEDKVTLYPGKQIFGMWKNQVETISMTISTQT